MVAPRGTLYLVRRTYHDRLPHASLRSGTRCGITPICPRSRNGRRKSFGGAQSAGAALVRGAARRLVWSLRGPGGGSAGGSAAWANGARPLRAHALEPRRPGRWGWGGWRRRSGQPAARRAGVRESRHPHLHGVRRVRSGVPQADPWRRAGPPLLGLGRVADRAPAEPARARCAHEHALRRDQRVVVRRRRRSHADAGSAPYPGGPRYGDLPCGHGESVHRAQGRRLPSL